MYWKVNCGLHSGHHPNLADEYADLKGDAPVCSLRACHLHYHWGSASQLANMLYFHTFAREDIQRGSLHCPVEDGAAVMGLAALKLSDAPLVCAGEAYMSSVRLTDHYHGVGCESCVADL